MTRCSLSTSHSRPSRANLGTWEPARHVWHVAEYERCLLVPTMHQWLGGPLPLDNAWPDDDASWASARSRPMSDLLSASRTVRQEQLELLEPLAAVEWAAPRATLWGAKPLARMGLWWRHIARQIAAHHAAHGDIAF